MTAGELIKEARINKGFTLYVVAKHLGVSESTMSKIESNTRKLKVEDSRKLAQIIGVDANRIQSIYLTDSIIKEHGDNPYIIDALNRAITIIKQSK